MEILGRRGRVADLDIITGNESQQNVVYLNDGSGNFDWLGNARSFGAGGDSTTSLAIEDTDGDGDLDIVTGNYNQQNAVYLNDGNGNFFTNSARAFGTVRAPVPSCTRPLGSSGPAVKMPRGR